MSQKAAAELRMTPDRIERPWRGLDRGWQRRAHSRSALPERRRRETQVAPDAGEGLLDVGIDGATADLLEQREESGVRISNKCVVAAPEPRPAALLPGELHRTAPFR